MIKLLRPFEDITSRQSLFIILIWIVAVFAYWWYATSGDIHLFPRPGEIFTGFKNLYADGLMKHLTHSLLLSGKAILIAMLVSLIFAYSSTMPVFHPLATTVSKFRYLPLTGITFYITMILPNAEDMQIGVLVVFMTTYFVTSLLSMINDIPQAEFDHARALKCNRWEVLWEVVIKGRLYEVVDIIRQNLAIAWMMIVTVESIRVAGGGLGVLIKNSYRWQNHGRVIALQIVILLVGLGIDFFLNFSRKTLFPYSQKSH